MNAGYPPVANFLELDGIARRFREVTALGGISLSVTKGEVVCLVGHSGCGKSTLLRIIAGIEMPDDGRVVPDGREMFGASGYVEPEDRNIGFMFQDYALFPHLSVVDNIMFGLKRLDRVDARGRCEEIIGRLGLERLAHRFPHMLSGGEQQRVALARALAPRPRIMLMDEPFSNLDRGLRDEIRAETIAFLRGSGTTVIMVTHDPEEALSTGDRVVLMRSGRIVQQGAGSDLYDWPCCAYVAEFFGSFNKVSGRCRGGFVQTLLGQFKAPGFADGDEAAVYVRPHDFRVDEAGDGIDGTVVDCRLMGEIEQILVSVAALPEPLKIRSTERRRLRAGERARISVVSEQVHIF